ncbi:GNAT family N-acetyltransferase [Opitutaceae bacterium]|nr:GNAT family N-acetyltransferase [Opitutaceae bacterium]
MTSFTQQIARESPSSSQISIFNPLERSDWDALVSRFPQCSFFHTCAWLKVLNETYGYLPVAIALTDQNTTIALTVFMEVDSWITGKRGVSLPFTDECQTLLLDEGDLPLLLDQVYALAVKRNWKSLETRSAPGLEKNALPSLVHYTHKLSLNPGSKSLFSQFSTSNRRAIRKAEDSELSIDQEPSLENLSSFYNLTCLTRKRHGMPPQPWKFFQAIHEQILTQGLGSIFLAIHKSKPIAGALFLQHKQNAIYKFGASDESFQAMRPNNFVMWNAIKSFAQNGCQQLDFGRTSLGNKGLRRFKLGWGSSEQTIPYIRRNIQSHVIETISDRTEGWYKHIFKILPTPLSRLAGQILYKHVA